MVGVGGFRVKGLGFGVGVLLCEEALSASTI